MKTIGITGGIGSGKSISTSIFKLLGVSVFYADIEAAMIMHQNTDVVSKLKEWFGKDIYSDYNILRREKFSELIFNDHDARLRVNELVHPLVEQAFIDWTKKQTSSYVMKEAALIFETGNYKNLDLIITVTAPEKMRIDRVRRRDDRSSELIRKIISQQWTEENKVKLSHFIINNDETEFLIPQVLKIHQAILNTEN